MHHIIISVCLKVTDLFTLVVIMKHLVADVTVMVGIGRGDDAVYNHPSNAAYLT